MLTAGVKCSEDELGIIEKRFLNVDGFNYYEFLKMLTDIDKKIKQCSVSSMNTVSITCV